MALQRFRGIFLRKFRRIRIRLACLKQNSGISSPDYLGHAGEIVLGFDGANPIPPITIFIRNAVSKTNHRGDDVRRADVGNIEAFHYSRDLR